MKTNCTGRLLEELTVPQLVRNRSSNFMQPERSSPCSQQPLARLLNQRFRSTVAFRNMLIFYGDILLDTSSYPKVEDRSLPAVRASIQYTCSYPPYLEAMCSIHNLQTSDAQVTGTALPLAVQ